MLERERVERDALLLRQPELVVEPGARPVLRRELVVHEVTIPRHAKHAADEDGAENEHQRLLFGALHGNSE